LLHICDIKLNIIESFVNVSHIGSIGQTVAIGFLEIFARKGHHQPRVASAAAKSHSHYMTYVGLCSTTVCGSFTYIGLMFILSSEWLRIAVFYGEC